MCCHWAGLGPVPGLGHTSGRRGRSHWHDGRIAAALGFAPGQPRTARHQRSGLFGEHSIQWPPLELNIVRKDIREPKTMKQLRIMEGPKDMMASKVMEFIRVRVKRSVRKIEKGFRGAAHHPLALNAASQGSCPCHLPTL